MIAGLRLTRRLFGAPSLAPWIGAELAPGADCQSEEALGEFLHRTVTTGYHPAGTCRMGRPDDRRSVVGPDLKGPRRSPPPGRRCFGLPRHGQRQYRADLHDGGCPGRRDTGARRAGGVKFRMVISSFIN